jgi:hypothetical protein
MREAYWAKRFNGARRADLTLAAQPLLHHALNPVAARGMPHRPLGGTIRPWAKPSFRWPTCATPRACRAYPAAGSAATGLLADRLGRPLRDLRISVTDRCNFRCTYCMPKDVFDRDYKFLPQTSSLLSFEEITRWRASSSPWREQAAPDRRRAAAAQARRALIGMLAGAAHARRRPLDITLTTNGLVLARKARPEATPACSV